MADDIQIEVSVELEKALANLKKLEDQIKSTKASVDQQLSPSVDNMGTKITGAGNRISGFGQKIRDNISGETALAFTALQINIIPTVDNVIIGNIMTLIPGIGLTTALKDLIMGDSIAGLLRTIEACITALAIAAGYFAVAFLTGGMI